MKPIFPRILGSVIAILGAFDGVLHAGEPDDAPPAAVTAGTYSWTGGCSIKCNDGTCQAFCSTGFVAAFDAASARIKAEAELKSQASARGTVVEGSVSISISLDPRLSESQTLRENLAARRYTWTGTATLRRNGQEITIQDSGEVYAENGDQATYLAGQALRYGAKIRNLEAQGWDCRYSFATCTGPHF